MANSKLLILLVCLTIGTVLSQQDGSNQRSNDDQRIVGGEEASIRDHPYQAYISLQKGNNTFQCGGSIITRNHILTAAHCLEGIDYATVRIGSNQAFRGGQTYKSSRFIIHPNYNSRTYDSDVAIITLSQTMQIDGVNTATISLARQGYYPAGGTTMTISGWGAIGENRPTSTTLRATTVSVNSKSVCQRLLGSNLVTDRSFCAGPLQGGRDSCQGDSGGPGRSVSNNVQIGIVSNGIGCARPNSPGIYANVGSFISWIQNATGGRASFAGVNEKQ